MSTRTIIEINHDMLGDPRLEGDLLRLLRALRGTEITGALNEAHKARRSGVTYSPGIRVYAQRHHSEERTLTFR